MKVVRSGRGVGTSVEDRLTDSAIGYLELSRNSDAVFLVRGTIAGISLAEWVEEFAGKLRQTSADDTVFLMKAHQLEGTGRW